MASMSVSGVVSGMDWDSMIDSIIESASAPAQPKVSKKTDLLNKKSLFEEMKVTMNSLQSSLSPLKLPSTYKAKQVDIERIDSSSSYKGVLTATVNADAEVNVYDIKVNQIATAQINRSKQITSSTLASTLGGLTSSTLYVNAGGQQVGIEVKATDSLESLKSRINTTLKTLDNPIHVTALVLDNKLILKSDNTGLGTYTNEEKINYNISGVNTLSNFTVDENNLDNLSITSGSKKYTIHKDYTIVNGNEIRWKQYDRSAEVALNDTVNVKYTMAANDVYTASGTYGTNEVDLSKLSWVDKGTLASRLKITDGTDTYKYGQDFTINKTTGKVVWLEEAGEKTNEPSSYNVSYNKTETVSTSINGTKGTSTVTYTDEPDSYIVRYDDKAKGSYDVTQSKISGVYDPISIDYTKLCELYKNTTGDDIQLFSKNVPLSSDPSRMIYYLDPPDRSALNITAGGTTYEYGRDFVIKTTDNTSNTSNGNWQIVWAGGNIVTEYRNSKSISATPQTAPSNGTSMTFSMAYDYDYTRMGRVSASDNDKLLTTIFGSDFDMSNFDQNMLKIRGYTYGTDFTVNIDTTSPDYGEIQWIDKTATSSSIDDVPLSASDFTALQNAYNQTYGTTSIPTVTLTDGDGVLRTYLDPADSSLFKMTSGGKTYEYGKDYVIRVNDDHKGYTISWAVSNDVNGDTNYDINDATTVVTTYTQYKKLTTYDMKKAPDSGNSYNLTFTGTSTKTDSGDVNSSDADKTLAHVLSGTTVNSSDYSSAITITSGSKTYTYGKDYVIDKSGTITWLNQNSDTPAAYTANYTFSSNPSVSMTVPTLNSNGINTIASPISINGLGTKTFTDGSYTYVDENEGKAAFTLTDSNGNTYEYGKDYAVRYSTTGAGAKYLTVVSAKEGYNWPSALTNRDSSTSMPKSGLTLTYNNSVSRTVISSETVEDAIGFIPSNYSKLSITDIDGNAYTAGTDYTLDSTTGAITWNSTATAPKHPAGAYTLTYKAFDPYELTGTYTAGTTTQAAEFETAEGYGNIGGNKLSYKQICTYANISQEEQSKIDSSLSPYFKLTDGTKTYEYGKDYRIIENSSGTADSKSGEYSPLIEWISGGATPTSPFTLTFTGGSGEALTTKGVKRSATDSITGTPAYSDLSGGTTTITQGSKTFYEGVDFNITKDSDSKAQIEWISGSDGGTEWYYPNPGSTYTINHTDDNGNTTTYTGTRDSNASLNMADYGMTTATGSISVQYGDGHSYKLDAPDSGVGDGRTVIKGTYGIDITPTTSGTFNFKWVTPTLTSRTDLPSLNEELTVTYDYDANVYTLTDDGDGLVDLLGLNDDVTAAQNAELVIDGQTITPASNDIGADYNNEIKGMEGITLHLKGVGEVSLDISHDAEKAVESIQTFVDNYNDLMTWMNTRMTENQVDKDTKATVDSDDFRMRWGLLHGNSLLRQTKSQMRNITSQNFTFSFTQRKSSEEVYGTMGFNGLKTSSTLRLRIGTKYVDVTIDPTDTLETIVKKISDDTKGGAMNDIYYDDNGNKLPTALLKASVENDKLVITSSSNEEITMSGTAAMNALKMNYTYKGLYQIGIESTSEDYGKSGELVFNSGEFMEALENNPDEVQTLMLKFVEQFSTWTRGMLNSSASGETPGTLTREINNIQSQVDDINEYLEKYQERLDRMEESLRTRYANTETSLARLNQQASSIAAILNQLNGMGGNNNSSSGS